MTRKNGRNQSDGPETAGKAVTYEDEVLQSIGDTGALVAVTAFAGDAPYRLADREIAGGKGKIAREEAVKIGDADVACAVAPVPRSQV